jgi:hypothetical protein
MISSACNAWISNSDSFPIFMRFALQKHTTSSSMARQPHLDLMLQSRPGKTEDDRCLITFEMPLEPAYWGELLIRRLEPHRLIYLDYSGEIGGDRGHVERVDFGILAWISQNDQELVFSLTLGHPKYRDNSGLWRFTQSKDPTLWHTTHLSRTRESGDLRNSGDSLE